MTIKLFLLIITCVVLGALAQLAMKSGMSAAPVQAALAAGPGPGAIWAVARSPLVIGGLLAYVIGAAMWLLVLAKADLSLVYPFTGLGFILTMLFGWLLLDENVTAPRIIGTLLIAVGAYLVSRS
jgi:uncharacterized membrane protein